MNKKMYFALAATAGLFASCSSDSLTENQAARMAGIDDNASAKIEIGLTPGYEITRGTGVVGTVGGTADAQWAGQKFNVLMLEKGTTLGARIDPTDATTSVIKGASFEATGSAVVALDNDAVYYPTLKQDGQSTGVYDFWGYRLDGSEVLDANDDVQFIGYDDATATAVKVPFVIDGTQDVMVAATTPSDAAYADANPDAIYSAKSARNGVKPNLSFKHLLTSLTFKVKAKSRDITTAATNPTTDANWRAGYQITNIQVKSKATGELVVAYTPGNEVADADRIEWKASQNWADATTLSTFQLQCRKKEVNDKADIKMVLVRSNASSAIGYETGYVDKSGASSCATPISDDLVVYTTGGTNGETGLPTGTETTIGALKSANPTAAYVEGYVLTYNSTDRTSPETPGATKKYMCDYKATSLGVTSDLVPFVDNADVDPVVLGWTGYTAGSAEIPVVVANEATQTTTFGGTVYDGTAASAMTLDEYKNSLPIGTNYEYFDGTNYTKFDVTTAYQAADPGSAGNADVSVVGEPMLVAPSDDAANSGYKVYVTYKYWKKKTASQAIQVTKTTEAITVNNYTMVGGARELGAFEAGKNYNVTITLYSDGEVLNGDATSEPWGNGGNLDAGDDN